MLIFVENGVLVLNEVVEDSFLGCKLTQKSG